MINDEEIDEYQNNQTKLLSEDTETTTTHLGSEIFHGNNELYKKVQLLNENSEINKNDPLSPSTKVSKTSLFPEIPKRFIILVLVTLAYFNMFCIRMCLNVTIVAMTHGEGKQYNSSGPHLSRDKEPDFHWDKQFQGTILASLYWGYTALQIPAGLLSVKYGGSFLLGIAIFGSSVLSLLTPLILRQNVYALLFLRIMEGAFLGLVSVAGISLITKWSPIYERSIFLMVGHSGMLWGTVFANALSGVLAGSSWGWPSVFFYFGAQGILWYLFWLYFAYEEPSDHPNITKAELEVIGKHWDTTIGLASSLPYVLSAVLCPAWGYFIDVLRSKRYISTTNARKFSSFIGAGVSGIFVVAVVYVSTATSAIVIVTIAITLSNFNTSGPETNIVELAPKYSCVLMGIANFACNLTGFISPEVVGAITVHGDIRHQWSIVFYITAGVNALGMTFYLCFGTSEKQAWADH
ncbi:vesicular glutamate transporter 3 isoform X2 [Paramuricea clavata]|uniref:Vesicular glutamate transporter 3 isoform X2 n=1 Tax=Paramuricea clavata TaxID=317549 RepID=A0A6S7H1Y9_PARCT|nr:vesicular glutamate transporter 3 isoform X2 [Paramuricea clavata]